MKTATATRVKEVQAIRYPIPKGLRAAAGMLKGRVPAALKYQKAVRAQWEKRARRK